MARRRADQAAATRAAILQAARLLFAERGFRDTSIDQIANEIGAARAALYHHFTNKQAIFLEVVRELESALLDRAHQVAEESSDGWDGIRAECESFLEACTEPDFQRIVILEAPSVLGEDSADPPQAIRYLTERLEPVVARQSLDAEAVAYSIYGTMQAMAQFITRAADPESARRAAQETLRRLLDGIST